MKKTVYICRDCPSCERIVNYINTNNVDVEVVNISDGGQNAPWIAVFPAYYEGDKLMAYGEDIITRFKSVA